MDCDKKQNQVVFSHPIAGGIIIELTTRVGLSYIPVAFLITCTFQSCNQVLTKGLVIMTMACLGLARLG